MVAITLVRHGETEWSRTSRHTGRTDIALTPRGEDQARSCAPVLRGRRFGLVLCSPLRRARDTAQLAGLTPELEPDLLEWDYGSYEGLTTKEIRASDPARANWTVWSGQPPGGETAEDVGARVDRVLNRSSETLDRGEDVCLVGHGHTLRIVAARWLGLRAAQGALLRLDTATLSQLGFEHENHVLLTWNAPPT